ncbi:hypothetical protein BDV10DRAFT_178140 [Aspergillus recurvatus]
MLMPIFFLSPLYLLTSLLHLLSDAASAQGNCRSQLLSRHDPIDDIIDVKEGGGSVLIPACQSFSGVGIGALEQGTEAGVLFAAADCIRSFGSWS